MNQTTELLTTQEAARFLRLQPQTLVNWRSAQREALPYVRIGGRVRYRKADLEAWIAAHLQAGDGQPLQAAAEA